MSLQWNGERIREQIVAELKRRVEACCVLVLNRARELLNTWGGSHGTGYAGSKRKRKIYHTNPSAPGEPPHKQLGHLRRSVAREVVGLVGRVGTNLLYGRWLELGTSKMAARPWLRRALAECRDQIRRILSKPIP